MTEATCDLYVLSDLHLGRGRNPETGRYHGLEAFFFDHELLRFCSHLCADAAARGSHFRLIFNGDAFDLLRVELDLTPGALLGLERRPAPELAPENAARLIEAILAGHNGFVDGLAVVLEAGHEVIFLPGNHDIEIQWPAVWGVIARVVLARLRDRAGEAAAVAAVARLRLEPWFYYEPGRIWLEHGCQYDPENAFRWFLRGAADDTATLEAAELDLPLGNFFQKYLYNGFGPVTFIVPTTRANFRYARWLLLNNPRLLAGAVTRHGPFALQWLRRMARRKLLDQQPLQRVHERTLDDLAARSELGPRLHRIDAMKSLRGDVLTALRTMLREIVRTGGGVLGVALLVTALWFAGFDAIQKLATDPAPRLALFLALNLLFAAAGVTVLGVAFFRDRPTTAPSPLVQAATRIAQELDVPIVSFGHTHEEAVHRVRRGSPELGWYYNTGTWIAVFTHDVLLPRERVQFTFLRVRGPQGELLHWNAALREPAEVVLLDE